MILHLALTNPISSSREAPNGNASLLRFVSVKTSVKIDLP